jgi:hypothetical protein
MKLRTMKKVFSKYGKDLSIKNGQGKVIAQYQTPVGHYKRVNKKFLSKNRKNNFYS